MSTASTAINAWLNPIDQLTIAIVAMIKGHSKRSSGLLASLMAEALDCQSIHQPIRVIRTYKKFKRLNFTIITPKSLLHCGIILIF